MTNNHPIIVVGGGLAGAMIALLFAREGERLLLLEARQDFRIQERLDDEDGGRFANSIKRSINLALSHRGISALKDCQLFDKIQSQLIPMEGRSIHLTTNYHHQFNQHQLQLLYQQQHHHQQQQSSSAAVDIDKLKKKFELVFQPYGTGDQAIYSVSRADLNRILLDELDKLPNAEMKFNMKTERVDKNGRVYCIDNDGKEIIFESKFVIGADGAYSKVRQSLQRLVRMDISIQHITSGYKELTLLPNKNNDYCLDRPSTLHIWPRHHHQSMLIALPNPDHSFTCTLFAPFDGEYGLNNLQSDDDILSYFYQHFPDFMIHIDNESLLQQFRQSPHSSLLSLQSSPWLYDDKIIMIGDAAHACVPFYGQGMNAAFEDALYLIELWRNNKANQRKTLEEFNQNRVPAGHAITQLSLENWNEMQSSTASKLFLFKKKIESCLHYLFPSWWIPKYTMVAFTRIPYHIAVQRAHRQEKLLNYSLLALSTAATVGLSSLGYYYRNEINQSLRSATSLLSSSSSSTTTTTTTATAVKK